MLPVWICPAPDSNISKPTSTVLWFPNCIKCVEFDGQALNCWRVWIVYYLFLHETGLIALNIRTHLVEGQWSGLLQGQVIKTEDFLSARVKKIWNSLWMKLWFSQDSWGVAYSSGVDPYSSVGRCTFIWTSDLRRKGKSFEWGRGVGMDIKYILPPPQARNWATLAP